MLLRNGLELCPLLIRHINSSEKLISYYFSKSVVRRICCKPLNQDFQNKRFASNKILYDEDLQDGWNRVYVGPLKNQIRAVKWFSLSSSLIGVVSQPLLYKEISSLGSIPIALAAYSFVGFFTVVTPVLLHLITKKYVTHIDYNSETGEYSAKIYTFICMLKEIKFKPNDVKVPDIPGMFTSIVVKGTPIFIDLNHFKDTDHYAKIMGYDKPMDFKLYGSESSNDNKNK